MNAIKSSDPETGEISSIVDENTVLLHFDHGKKHIIFNKKQHDVVLKSPKKLMTLSHAYKSTAYPRASGNALQPKVLSTIGKG